MSSVVFGLVPSLRASKQDVQSTLRDGGRGAGVVRDRVRQALIVAEVALACTLLAGAGLLARSALYLQHVKTGFDPNGLVTARVALPEVKYKEPARALQAYHALMEQLARLPGVQSASLGVDRATRRWRFHQWNHRRRAAGDGPRACPPGGVALRRTAVPHDSAHSARARPRLHVRGRGGKRARGDRERVVRRARVAEPGSDRQALHVLRWQPGRPAVAYGRRRRR